MKNKLELKNVSFSFGNSPAVENVSLDVEEGSFTTLLGPSGCGKTTLLRLISGFLTPKTGEILIDGVNQAGIEVNERKVGIVFQDYALFPHLSVKQNIAYGLKIQKLYARNEIAEKVSETALALGIEEYLDRFPNELSGGQQQRVALARSLVLKPKILLMDEPLSSLDTKLRNKVREELREIQQRLKITTIYVTHDQEEALSLSTKIAVLNKGMLLQEGTPHEIYFEPESRFVADFVGKANFIKKDGKVLMIRPEWFELAPPKFVGEEGRAFRDTVFLSGTMLSHEFLGSKCRFIIQTTNTELKEAVTIDLDTLDAEFFRIGEQITVRARRSWEM